MLPILAGPAAAVQPACVPVCGGALYGDARASVTESVRMSTLEHPTGVDRAGIAWRHADTYKDQAISLALDPPPLSHRFQPLSPAPRFRYVHVCASRGAPDRFLLLSGYGYRSSTALRAGRVPISGR